MTSNTGLTMFDVNLVPMALAAKISVTSLARVDERLLDYALSVSFTKGCCQARVAILTDSDIRG